MTVSAAKRRVLIGPAEIDRILARIAHQILEPEDAQGGLYLIGIRRGGEALTQRLAAQIERISGQRPPVGFLNINLYRDDEVTHQLRRVRWSGIDSMQTGVYRWIAAEGVLRQQHRLTKTFNFTTQDFALS